MQLDFSQIDQGALDLCKCSACKLSYIRDVCGGEGCGGRASLMPFKLMLSSLPPILCITLSSLTVEESLSRLDIQESMSRLDIQEIIHFGIIHP